MTEESKLKQAKDFGYTFSVIGFLFVIVHWYKREFVFSFYYLFPLVFLIVSYFSPRIFYHPARIWLKIGKVLSILMNPVIMGVLYFFFITPYSIILRVFTKTFLNLNRNQDVSSYWEQCEKQVIEKEYFERQY